MTYVVPWWSPSKFVCWDQCPAEFAARYVEREPMVVTEALHFGTAVHRGLEAHYLGQDGTRAFRQAWRELSTELLGVGVHVSADLSRTGLELIEQVMELGLTGVPERLVWIRTDAFLGAPTLGYTDLWCTDRPAIIDFKTTVGAWSQERAEREMWQPCLYTWAYWSETGLLPSFEYIVLNRKDGTLSRFATRRDHDDIGNMLERAHQIARQLERQDFPCICPSAGKICPECGGHWRHGHACEAHSGLRIRLQHAAD